MLKRVRKFVVASGGHGDPSPDSPVAHPTFPRPNMSSVVPSAAMLSIVVDAGTTVPGTTVGATTTLGRALPNEPSSHMMKTAVLPLRYADELVMIGSQADSHWSPLVTRFVYGVHLL